MGYLFSKQKKSDDDEYISEGDAYRLVCKSITKVATPRPEAIEFEKWVFDEILPTLRRTGTYTIEDDENLNVFIKMFRRSEQ